MALHGLGPHLQVHHASEINNRPWPYNGKVNQLEKNITWDFAEEQKNSDKTPELAKKRISIIDIIGLLIILSGILGLLGIYFYDALRDILASRPISENSIETNGMIGIICSFIQITVGTGIIIAHMLLKKIKIHTNPEITWK